MLKLFEVNAQGEKEIIDQFEDFYECIEVAESLTNVKCFNIEDTNEGKKHLILIGMRIQDDEVWWRIKRKGIKIRGRDTWFYQWLKRILVVF